MTRKALAIGLWRVRLSMTGTRCLHIAEQSLEAAEMHGGINRACQQKDARIYSQRGRDALLAVASIDQMTEARTTMCLPGGSTAKGLSAGHATTGRDDMTSHPLSRP